MSESKTYKNHREYLRVKHQEWEGLCIRCGGCCGAYDNPCQHLKENKDSTYCCSIYSERFGIRRSIAGEHFDCVSIKDIIHTHWRNDHLCIYKKYLKTPWGFSFSEKNINT